MDKKDELLSVLGVGVGFELMFLEYNKFVKKQYILVVNQKGYIQFSLEQMHNNKNTRKVSSMFYQFNYQTQANFEDADYSDFQPMKAEVMPTTSHNSPTSFKSESPEAFHLEFSHDNSFEAAAQMDHAKCVWDSSVNYLKNSLSYTIDQQLGFNNDDMYNTMTLRSANQPQQKTLPESINKNKLLKLKQRSKFTEQIQKETQICSLLVELMVLFNENIFNQMVFVIQNIWEKRYLNYRQNKKNANRLGMIPQFKCFFGFQEEENLMNNGVDMNEHSDAKQVKKASEEDIQALALEMFRSKKLKYLNFSEIRFRKNDQSVLKKQFVLFVKALSKSVFLSAEGIYEEDLDIPIFSEQDQEEFSADFSLENSNRFIRTFSQIQQEDEEFAIQPTNSKRRKSQ